MCWSIAAAFGAASDFEIDDGSAQLRLPISCRGLRSVGFRGAGFLDPIKFPSVRQGFDRTSGLPGGRDRRRGAVAHGAAQCLGSRGSDSAQARHANPLKTIIL